MTRAHPVTGMTHATAGLSVAYLVDGGADWVTITLSAGTFLASAGGDGWYRITLPDAAIVASSAVASRHAGQWISLWFRVRDRRRRHVAMQIRPRLHSR